MTWWHVIDAGGVGQNIEMEDGCPPTDFPEAEGWSAFELAAEPRDYQRFDVGLGAMIDDLDTLRALKWAMVKAHREQIERGIAPTPIGPVQIDDQSKLKISGLVQMALIAAAAGAPFEEEFTLADNSIVLLDAPLATAMGVAVAEFVSAVFATARQLRGLIDAAEDRAAIEAIDVDAASWPSAGEV